VGWMRLLHLRVVFLNQESPTPLHVAGIEHPPHRAQSVSLEYCAGGQQMHMLHVCVLTGMCCLLNLLSSNTSITYC
jgi:hypothetical protein